MQADTTSRLLTTRDGRAGSIRPAVRGDAAPCLAIVRQATMMRPRTIMTTTNELWSAREWRKRMLDLGDAGITLIAEVDGEVAGLLGSSRGDRPVTRHVAEIGITVAESLRGIGLGTALMEGFEAWARSNGVERIVLGVYSHNEQARALYKKCGYETEGVEQRSVKFPEGYADTVRMAKQL